MAWLHVRIWSARVLGDESGRVMGLDTRNGNVKVEIEQIEEHWKRVPRSPYRVRQQAAEVLTAAGYEVAPHGHPWDGKYPHEVSAYLCMKRGGGRAGSSIETLKVRRRCDATLIAD
jgi:hypothetical protein